MRLPHMAFARYVFWRAVQSSNDYFVVCCIVLQMMSWVLQVLQRDDKVLSRLLTKKKLLDITYIQFLIRS